MSTQPDMDGTDMVQPERGPAMGHDRNGELQPRMVLSAIRETMALRLRAQSMTWPRIAEECGYADEKAAREACKRGLKKMRLGTEEDLEDLIAQAEQVIEDVRVGALRHEPAGVMLRGLGFIAKLKNVEPGTRVEHQHEHRHAVAHALVSDVEEFQSLLGEVADREVQRRLAEAKQDTDEPNEPVIDAD